MPDPPPSLQIPATSPLCPQRKPYVVPSWAHTDNAFRPHTVDGKYADPSELVPSDQLPHTKPPKRAREKDDSGPPKPRKRSSHYKDLSENGPACTFHGPATLTPPRASSSSSRAGDAPRPHHRILSLLHAVRPLILPPQRRLPLASLTSGFTRIALILARRLVRQHIALRHLR